MIHRCLCFFFLLTLTLPALAQDIPPALRDWQGWVLHDVRESACPFLSNQNPDGSRQCIWPGQLALTADGHGASFALGVEVDSDSWLLLPGDSRYWPQDVTVNGQAQPVMRQGDQPALRLQPGTYRIQGRLPWSRRPAQLRVPGGIGLVTLQVDGKPVIRVERNGEQLTLGETATAQREVDALAIRIYRQLGDGLPATLETRLQFNVTGSARELILGPALPRDFTATRLGGDLPARLENDGRLRVQLRPGQWTLALDARATGILSRIDLQPASALWPAQEVWSYADAPDLRSTRVEGTPTDAAQAGVPTEWQGLPAFALDSETGLNIQQSTRGIEGGRGDQLALRRQLWLDFDGHGLIVADQMNGNLRLPQRLGVSAPWQLQRAAQNGQALVITVDPRNHNGVELRDRELNLQAGLRLADHSGAFPVNAWQLPLERIDANLYLPYGYRLIGASGVDQSPDAWIQQWDLLDLFIVALISLLAGRLLGWRWALLTALMLALGLHESGVPRWTLGIALALALLMRALPQGRLRALSRIGAIAVLALAVLCSLPFIARQMDYALHPQLESAGNPLRGQTRAYETLVTESAPMAMTATGKDQDMVPAASMEMVDDADMKSSGSRVYSRISGHTSSYSNANFARNRVDQIQDNRNVSQAGAGIPQWEIRNNGYRLKWSGPVAAEQTARLIIAPAWLVRMLRVLLVALLIALLARTAITLGAPLKQLLSKPPHAAAATGLLLSLCLPLTAWAQATPSDERLAELRARLSATPACAPACATIANARLRIEGDVLSVDLEAHAGAAVALPLPLPDSALALREISADGRSDPALAQRNGITWLRLERGVHKVLMRYRIEGSDNANLRFVLPPQGVSFSGPGWAVSGLTDGRLLGDSLALTRERGADAVAGTAIAQSFPPYVRLTRRLLLGLDWSVENTVERIAPESDGFTVSLPLLPGEHPLGDDAQIQNGRIAITLNSNQPLATWNSRLERAADLRLTAPGLGERTEVWEISAAPIWHVDAQGVPPSDSEEGLRFQPLPGETLQLAVSQPAAAAGDSIAFDRVKVETSSGERVSETTLTLHARSTRGGAHSIDLPADAELLAVSRDGNSLNLTLNEGELSLPLLPGEHTYSLRLRQPQGASLLTHTPSFALHAPTANIELNQNLPQNRWLLWTWGPTAGPAVLYWSRLLVLLVAAWLLARYAPTPLRLRHWLLLGLGFSAFSWLAFCFVTGWLIVLGLRARHVPFARRGAILFDLSQLALVLLSLIALAVLILAVPSGLLGKPDMHITGIGSYGGALNWFADQTDSVIPQGGVFSVSIWFYKIAILAWALWLANALIGWLRWGFKAWSQGGYWRRPGKRADAEKAAAAEARVSGGGTSPLES
ncbi:MAG: hypothetical protein LBL59_04055 [Xanthomonadaceae bacterium]|jgi:hypothetical protein|nr:hypothetical protein [Xanthomonadaceae bacterium]